MLRRTGRGHRSGIAPAAGYKDQAAGLPAGTQGAPLAPAVARAGNGRPGPWS